MNAHPMITRSKRKNVSTTIVTEPKTNHYIYIVLGLLPLYSIFAIAFYFMVNNLGYNTLPAGIYLGFGSYAYGSLMNQVNVQ
jgi:hypothetical protein